LSIIEENKVKIANCNFSKNNFIFYFGASPITRISIIESNKVKLQTVPQELIFNFGAQPIRGGFILVELWCSTYRGALYSQTK